MTRHLMTLTLAFCLSAVGSPALAGKPCPFNDKQLPEESKVCRAGTIQQCEDGKWVDLGIKCTSRLHEGGYAATAIAPRTLAVINPRRDAIVARIAPRS